MKIINLIIKITIYLILINCELFAYNSLSFTLVQENSDSYLQIHSKNGEELKYLENDLKQNIYIEINQNILKLKEVKYLNDIIKIKTSNLPSPIASLKVKIDAFSENIDQTNFLYLTRNGILEEIRLDSTNNYYQNINFNQVQNENDLPARWIQILILILIISAIFGLNSQINKFSKKN